MIIQALAFYLFATVAIASAVMVISARNPVHSVLFLILAFFNAAGLFVLMGAEFIAMTASFNAWCAARPNAPAGTIVQDPQEAGTTHPSTAWIEFDVRGVRHRRRDSVDIVYHLQRVFEVVDALHANARARFDDIVKRAGGTELMAMRLSRRIAYSAFRYELA